MSASAKIALQDAELDWRELKFRATLATFPQARLDKDEFLRATTTALVGAARSWEGFFDLKAEEIQGEGPADTARAQELLLTAKKNDVQASVALEQAIREETHALTAR